MTQPTTVTIPHTLGQAEAHRRIDQGCAGFEQQVSGSLIAAVSIEQRSEADRLHFTGKTLGQVLTGRLDALPETVRIQLDLPPLLAGIAGRISWALRQHTQKLLGKT